MSELAIPNQAGAVMPANAETSPLVLWAYEANQAYGVAEALSRTAFVPATMKGKPDDIVAAILAGHELGLKPMAALRSMDVIQGTPALRAHAMRGLVQANGHHIQMVESTETRCRMRGRRADDAEWQTVTWTIERATKLGLTGKDQWRKQPQTMLVARATSELCRLIAADVLYAMPYAAEELGDPDIGAEPAPADAETKPARRTAQRRKAATPPPANDPEPDLEPEPAQAMITDPQMRMLQALFAEKNIGDRDAKLAFASELLGRDLGSATELTKAEASKVIDTLANIDPVADIEPDLGGPQ